LAQAPAIVLPGLLNSSPRSAFTYTLSPDIVLPPRPFPSGYMATTPASTQHPTSRDIPGPLVPSAPSHPPPENGRRSDGRRRSGRSTLEDPVVVLRSRQLAEYQKLCVEIRLPENSAIKTALEPLRRNSEQADGVSDPTGTDFEARLPNSPHEYDFTGCYLGDKQFLPLAAAIAVDKNLMAVLVPNTGMHDKGMVELCRQLNRSATLECLDVSRNRFSIDGAEACLKLAASAPSLILVRSRDSVLDEDFCVKRALPSNYSRVRLSLSSLLSKRLEEASWQRAAKIVA